MPGALVAISALAVLGMMFMGRGPSTLQKVVVKPGEKWKIAYAFSWELNETERQTFIGSMQRALMMPGGSAVGEILGSSWGARSAILIIRFDREETISVGKRIDSDEKWSEITGAERA